MAKHRPDLAENGAEFARVLNDSAQLLRQNRPEEAVRLLLPLHERFPIHADVAINLGGAYILQRKWNRAVRVLEPAARHHAENVMLWVNLAAAELGNLEISGPRQQEKAIAAYERALQINPKTPNVHYHLGLIHKHRGDLTRARDCFRSALDVMPTDRDARLWLERIDLLLAQNRPALQTPNSEAVDHRTQDTSPE